MATYRSLPADRETEFRQFVQYAFQPENGPAASEGDDERPDIGDRRGMFDGDDLRCVCTHYWFTTRIRGDWHEMAGLSGVASPPESRRRGFVRDMLAESLAEYREREVYFSALWPFSYEFYRKYGWGTVNKYTEYETTPEALDTAVEPAGEFRRLGADDWELLVPAFDAHSETYALGTDRTEDWWQERVLQTWWSENPYVYAWMRDGEARGYLVYSVDDADAGKKLDVWEMASVDDEAHRQLLRFLQYHDSQVDTVTFSVPESTALLDAVANPRDVDCEIRAGPMFRLVDVPRALESLSYGVDTTVVFRVTDPLVDWNEGTFELETGDEVRCTRTDADPDVTTDVNTFSQLVAGYHSVTDAERFGSFEVHDGNARARFSDLFPEQDVYLRERF